jgi:hypothetical protein
VGVGVGVFVGVSEGVIVGVRVTVGVRETGCDICKSTKYGPYCPDHKTGEGAVVARVVFT